MAAAAILNLFEPKIVPLDPPSPKTPPYNQTCSGSDHPLQRYGHSLKITGTITVFHLLRLLFVPRPIILARGEITGIFKSEIIPSPFLFVAMSLIFFAMPVI